MKQRLQIARGLINNPEYIFLDEPTLGLDIVIAREIRELVKRLALEDEKGILLTTHYINEAEELCDYIYIIDQGRMIAEGTREELQKVFSCQKDSSEVSKLEDVLMYLITSKDEERREAGR